MPDEAQERPAPLPQRAAKIEAEGNPVSILGLWRRYWRVLYHEALILEQPIGGSSSLDAGAVAVVSSDLDFFGQPSAC